MKQVFITVFILSILASPCFGEEKVYIYGIENKTGAYTITLKNGMSKPRHVFYNLHTITENGREIDAPGDVKYDIKKEDKIVDYNKEGRIIRIKDLWFQKSAFHKYAYMMPGQQITLYQGHCRDCKIGFLSDVTDWSFKPETWEKIKVKLKHYNPNWTE